MTLQRFLLLLIAWMGMSHLAEAQQQGMFRGDLRHTGSYDTDAVHHVKQLTWRFKTEGPIRGAVTLANDLLYVGSGDGYLYALHHSSGALVWRYKTGGSVQATPAVAEGIVYVASRDAHVYALDATSGEERWRFKMGEKLPYHSGFDEYISSPAVTDDTVYIGSGDGHVYALHAKTGEQVWRFKTEGLVRASPAVDGGTVYIGDMEGWLYAVDQQSGTQIWRYGSVGSTLNTEDFGYDREALKSSPALTDDLVVVGGRDGFLYAIERTTGHERWRFNHDISWVVSSPALDAQSAYVGSSDGRFVHAVDLETGDERWRTTVESNIWSSVALAEGIAYVGDMSGRLYALNTENGHILWQFLANANIKATPVVDGGTVYIGDDGGELYAISGSLDPDPTYVAPHKAVYWEATEGFKWFSEDTDKRWRDVLMAEDYALLHATELARFMNARITDQQASVIVFAANRVPLSVVADTSETALIRRYLDAGGKVAWLGAPPMAYKRNWDTEQVIEINFSPLKQIFGIQYPEGIAAAYGTFTRAEVTHEGRTWGLSGWWIACCSLSVDQVTTVLGRDEFGAANAWVKNFGGPPGTGLVQLRVPRDRLADVAGVKAAIEFGF